MSEDIFISYRRGDADSLAAGRLYDGLKNDFAVYLDTSRKSNDLGTDFGRGIEAALASCRVVFAVIGPQWVSEEGLRRLNDPGDWVRRELAIALSRPDAVRVIPLYVARAAPPDFSVLPVDLQALAGANGRRLEADDWANDVQELITGLNSKWLAVQRGATVPGRLIPPMLPYLCDRREQEDGLVDLIQQQSRTAPIACVVHGHRWEAHAEFLDRLRYQKALEDLLDAQEDGIAVRTIQLSRDRLRDGRHRDALFSALKAAVLRRRTATDAELRAYFMKLPQPLVAVIELTSADVESDAGSSIDLLVEAWRALLRLESVAANVDDAALRRAAVLWINVAYDDVDVDVDVDGHPAAAAIAPWLPQLKPVEDVHIREWLGLDEVKPFVAHRKHELEDLSASAHCFEPGRIHMRTFADAVRDILARD